MQPADRTLLLLAALCLMVPVLFAHLVQRYPYYYRRNDRVLMALAGTVAFALALTFIFFVLT